MTVSILSLPFYLLEIISRFLLPDHKKDNFGEECDLLSIYTAHGFAKSLKCFWATCHYIQGAVSQSWLEFSLDLDYVQQNPMLLENIANYTEWKVAVLYLRLNQNRPNIPAESCVLAVFGQNRQLVQKMFRLKQIFIDWDPNQYTVSYLREVLNMFIGPSNNCKVHLTIVGWLVEEIPDDERRHTLPEVTQLEIAFFQWSQKESLPDSIIRAFIDIMPNVKELCVHHHKLNNISLISNWTILKRLCVPSVGNISKTEHYFHNLYYLRIDYFSEKSLNVINKTFKNLKTINFRAAMCVEDAVEGTAELSLPCVTVGMNVDDLKIIKESKHVKNLFVKRFVFNRLENLLEFNAELDMLLVHFISTFPDTNVHNEIVFVESILSRFASLEILGILVGASMEHLLITMAGSLGLGQLRDLICEKMSTHRISLLVIESSFRGRIVFAKSNLSSSQLENYAAISSAFNWSPICISLFPAILDGVMCKNGIYISASDIGSLKHALFATESNGNSSVTTK